MIKRYFLLKCFPEPGTGVPIHNGIKNPAIIGEIGGCPIGLSMPTLEISVKDPLERAIVMAQGIIGEYQDSTFGENFWYLKRAWRVKKKGLWFVRGHRLKVRE